MLGYIHNKENTTGYVLVSGNHEENQQVVLKYNKAFSLTQLLRTSQFMEIFVGVKLIIIQHVQQYLYNTRLIYYYVTATKGWCWVIFLVPG